MSTTSARPAQHGRLAATPAATPCALARAAGSQPASSQSIEERLPTLMRVIGEPRRPLRHRGIPAFDAIFLGNINLGQAKWHQLDLDIPCGVSERLSIDVDVQDACRHRNVNVSVLQQAPRQNWQSVPGSETMASTLNVGLNHIANKPLTINGSVALGLAPDAPNLAVDVRFPHAFRCQETRQTS